MGSDIGTLRKAATASSTRSRRLSISPSITEAVLFCGATYRAICDRATGSRSLRSLCNSAASTTEARKSASAVVDCDTAGLALQDHLASAGRARRKALHHRSRASSVPDLQIGLGESHAQARFPARARLQRLVDEWLGLGDATEPGAG